MEKTKITIMCENRAGAGIGIIGEHGFSALIEKNNEKILMDTGQGLGLKANATALKINLSDINKIVLSHGHFDHTGGLADLMPQKEKIDVYAHPDIFAPKYARHGNEGEKKEVFIGTRFSQEYLESNMNAKFHFKKEFSKISNDIFFSGVIPRQTDFERQDKRLLVKEGQSFIQDPLHDDASLLIETSSGPVILTGCAHSGIVNIMNHFSKKTGYKSFHAVIGGTHLGFLNSDKQLEKTMDAFAQYDLKLIAVSHCTGNEAAAVCYNRFKDKFAFANAGWSARF
ncbi:MBL fold metallo-hydrolase [Desulfobacula sp.]|uniref:MBL fold metallo-hydrolase n=1 Tax=Desulfobacula sp. TaxID=2593537 RepID=UPI002638075C|nr:MBL fold metallo-hydrolase [Desulfobacula sp.]